METRVNPNATTAFRQRLYQAWFDRRGRKLGWWAFVLNRLSGLLLVGYLLLHFAILSTLVWNPAGYDAFIRLAGTRPMLLLDTALGAVLLYHGINGLRIILVGLGIAPHRQREFFWAGMAVMTLLVLWGGYRLLGG